MVDTPSLFKKLKRMYAQAWYLIQTGFDYWFSIDETRHLAPYINNFMVESSEEQLLPVYFEPCQQKPGKPGKSVIFKTIYFYLKQ